MINEGKGLKIFYCYSHKDEEFRDELESHLAILRRKGVISDWSDRKILPGAEWKKEIDDKLGSANIVLILVSADFLASDYCYDVELEQALACHKKGELIVVPIILRPVDFTDSPFAELQALPTDARPVTTWPNRDEAWLSIARGIKLVCKNASGLRAIPDSPLGGSSDLLGLETKENDFGILDFIAELEVALQVATDCQQAIGNDAVEMTTVLDSKTKEARSLKDSAHPGRASQVRQIAASIGASFAAYAKKTESRVSELREAWDRVDHFFPKLLQTSNDEDDRMQMPGLIEVLRNARDSMRRARDSAMSAKDSMSELGRLSGALALGTRRAQMSLQAVIDQYWRIENSLEQMVSLIEARFN